jgi:signal transduction histidine kinase
MRRIAPWSSGFRRVVLVTALVVAVLTLIAVVVPAVHFAYRASGLHIALETAAALVASLAAYLVLGRYRRSARIDRLALVSALWLFAVSNFFLGAIPAAALGARADVFSSWASSLTATVGAGIFMLAAYLRPTPVSRPVRAERLALGATTLLVVLTAIVTYLLQARLPAAVLANDAGPGQPHLDGHPILVQTQLAAVLAFAAAALAFMRRAEGSRDDLMRWLAVGSVLAAGSRLNYFLYPSLYSQWVSIGDAFRVLFYFVLLLGAAREISRYWSSVAEAAVLEERRRIARDLHDGLAQELTYLLRRGRKLLATGTSGGSEIAASAARALGESRRAIAALTLPLDQPMGDVLSQTLSDVARRNGARIKLELEPVDVSSTTREALLRVASEAVWNAAQHAHAQTIHVKLFQAGGIRLEVLDDGTGFDVAAEAKKETGFGLRSMRERVAALGGTFACDSALGRGTRIEVVVP